MMSEKINGGSEVGRVEAVIRPGKDDQLDRNSRCLIAGYAVVVAPFHQTTALAGGGPVVELADQNQGRHGHSVLELAARRIEGDRGAKLVRCGLLDCAAFDGRHSKPAALRE